MKERDPTNELERAMAKSRLKEAASKRGIELPTHKQNKEIDTQQEIAADERQATESTQLLKTEAFNSAEALPGVILGWEETHDN
jgi:hypothetical protein